MSPIGPTGTIRMKVFVSLKNVGHSDKFIILIEPGRWISFRGFWPSRQTYRLSLNPYISGLISSPWYLYKEVENSSGIQHSWYYKGKIWCKNRWETDGPSACFEALLYREMVKTFLPNNSRKLLGECIQKRIYCDFDGLLSYFWIKAKCNTVPLEVCLSRLNS